MKKFALTCIACFCCALSFAQITKNSDSLAYELQRAKINQMLNVRHQKFGQYDISLKKHTGIFGLQTKKDIRRSNDILMDIARTDDSIFIQTKILLSYKTFQQQQAQTKSAQAEDYSLNYMNTINRLRAQMDRMKADAVAVEKSHQSTQRIYIIAVVLMLGSILILLFKKRAVSA